MEKKKREIIKVVSNFKLKENHCPIQLNIHRYDKSIYHPEGSNVSIILLITRAVSKLIWNGVVLIFTKKKKTQESMTNLSPRKVPVLRDLSRTWTVRCDVRSVQSYAVSVVKKNNTNSKIYEEFMSREWRYRHRLSKIHTITKNFTFKKREREIQIALLFRISHLL